MLRLIYAGNVQDGKQYVEMACLSTDVKPVGAYLTGSLLHVVDEKKIYAYNEAASSGEEWVEQIELGGGS